MAINFPTTPVLYQEYASGDKTWIWNGYAWDVSANNVVDYNSIRYKPAANIVLTGNITGSSNVLLTANTNIININTTLENTGVIAASYGSASLVPVITVDTKGRITTASTVAVSGGSTAISFKTSFLLMGA